MKDIKVSVVLPIYKVEKFLDECIESVVNQTYKNLEIILVDDGSPDRCPKICDEWAKKDKRIKVIHKQNEGLGMARNTGIDIAKGNYICFFDSDDYLAPTLIEKCVNKLLEYKADFVIYGFCDVTEEKKIVKEYIPTTSKYYFEEEEIKSILIKQLYSSNNYKNENYNLKISAWNCMLSKKLIDKLEFKFVSEREIISEDVYSMLIYYANMKKACIINENLYFHRINNKSLTHEFRKDRFDKLNVLYLKLNDLCIKLKLDLETKKLMSTPYLNGVFGAFKLLVESDSKITDKYKNYKTFINNSTFQNALKDIDLSQEGKKRKLMIVLFKFKLNFISYFILVLSSMKRL